MLLPANSCKISAFSTRYHLGLKAEAPCALGGEESAVALPFVVPVFSGWKSAPTEEDIRKLCESRTVFSDPGVND